VRGGDRRRAGRRTGPGGGRRRRPDRSGACGRGVPNTEVTPMTADQRRAGVPGRYCGRGTGWPHAAKSAVFRRLTATPPR